MSNVLCSGLDHNFKLEELNLSDNRIGCFKELLNLARLPALRSLSFSDPHYGDNPVCGLCNYQTYVMYQLHQLTSLDTMAIREEAKQMAEATYMKKKMYYNMRIKTLKRNTTNILRKAQECAKAKIVEINVDLNQLSRTKKDVEYELDYLAAHVPSGDEDETTATDATALREQLLKKMELVNRSISENAEKVKQVTRELEVLKLHICDVSEQNITRLLLELETGGNIRLEDGKPSDVWFSSCVDLVNSRFFPPDFRPHGIADIKVHRVTRIHNRFLRNRFETRMESALAKEAATNGADSGGGYKRSLEYLFYGQSPVLGVGDGLKQHAELLRVIEEGFHMPDQYRQMGITSGAIRLSNSVSISDIPRIGARFHAEGRKLRGQVTDPAEFRQFEDFGSVDNTEICNGPTYQVAKTGLAQGQWDIPEGMLLIVKAFLGNCGSVEPNDSEGQWPERYPSNQSVSQCKKDDAKQKEWFVFENAMVLPEYLVEFEYVTATQRQEAERRDKAEPDSAIAQLRGQLAGLGGSTSSDGLSEQEIADLNPLVRPLLQFTHKHSLERTGDNAGTPSPSIARVLQMAPALKQRPSLSAISAEAVLANGNSSDPTTMTYLNLYGCGIKTLESSFGECTSLKTLILSFNEIRKIEGLSGLRVLEKLDLSFNLLTRLDDNLRGLDCLATLEVNNNLLEQFDDLSILAECVPPLVRLDMQNNFICDQKSYRALAIHKVPKLTVLDGAEVTAADREAANELFSRITPRRIRSCARGAVLGQGLKRLSEPSRISDSGPGVQPETEDDTGGTDGDEWWQQVEQLEMNHQGLQKLHGLEKLTNLRRASFIDNALTCMEGLEKCQLLEELSVEENRIGQMDGISSMVFLKKLDMGKNMLVQIAHLDTLAHLTQLSLEDNKIGSLSGLQRLSNLMELYIGNNKISVVKEIQHLKELPKLIILDLSGNPLCQHEHYRLYSIYHLRKLKVLDGTAVDSNEQSLARDRYSGKLTTDFLIEKLGHYKFDNIRELELASCRVREIEQLSGEHFPNLRELNLDNNFITSVNGLHALPHLVVLRLNHNRIESLCQPLRADELPPSPNGSAMGVAACQKLEVLQLGYNCVTDMAGLGLHFLPELKVRALVLGMPCLTCRSVGSIFARQRNFSGGWFIQLL
jgi:Leucine-rich repeat (LRR) protein